MLKSRAGTDTPLIADAVTGYGGLLNIAQTVKGYETAGACGIQIEDQETPKKCGHTPGRRVVPIEDMVRRVQWRLRAGASPITLIIARTDARTSLGLDEAMKRAEAYAGAGADVIFVESPETEQELKEIGRKLAPKARLTGVTPQLSVQRLKDLGFSIAIFPDLAFSTAAAAIDGAYRHLKEQQTTEELPVPYYRDMHSVMGFPEVWEFEKRWAVNE